MCILLKSLFPKSKSPVEKNVYGSGRIRIERVNLAWLLKRTAHKNRIKAVMGE